MKYAVGPLIGALIIIGVALAGIIMFATACLASPFIVCDPQAGVTSYQITGWTVSTQQAETDGSVKLDVASASVGTTNLTFAACKNDATWGVLCSEAVPFSFTRPSQPAIPANIGLIP